MEQVATRIKRPIRAVLATRGTYILSAIVACFVFLLFFEMPKSWLFDPDEARYAEIPREMLATHDFLTPRLNGANYFEKPPLLYWLNAGSLAILGQNEFAARLPIRLAAVGTLLLLLLGFSRSSPLNTGLWAALVFISSPLPFALGRINLTDGILTFGLTLVLFSLRRFIEHHDRKARTTIDQLFIGIGLAWAVLSKGLIGVFIPASAILIWTSIIGRWDILRALLFSWTPFVFLLLASPWFVLMELANPGFSRFFFYQEHLLRYASNYSNRKGPFFYFVITFLVGFLPWMFYIKQSIRPLLSRQRDIWRRHADDALFLIWATFPIVFFSFSHSKLIPYIYPVFPAAAALVGKWAATQINRHRQLLVQAGSFGLVYLILIFSSPYIARDYSDHDLAVAALNAQADQTFTVISYSQSFPWIFKKPIPVVDFQGELASDNTRSPVLFWTRERFLRLWNSNARVVAYTHRHSQVFFDQVGVKKSYVIAQNHSGVVLANFQQQ